MAIEAVTLKKTADELRHDAKLAARQAMELRQTAHGLFKRADALERLSGALLRRAARISLKSK